MKYIRIQTSQGSVYLNKHTRKVYMFPPFVPKLSSWPSIVMLLCTAVLLLVPYLFLQSLILDINRLIALLCGVVFAAGISIYFSWKEQDIFFDYLSQAHFTNRPDYKIKELFKKQVLKKIRLSIFTILLFSFVALGSYWIVKGGEAANYGYFFGIFSSGPAIIIYLIALRPIGTLVDYLHYSAEGGKNDDSLPNGTGSL